MAICVIWAKPYPRCQFKMVSNYTANISKMLISPKKKTQHNNQPFRPVLCFIQFIWIFISPWKWQLYKPAALSKDSVRYSVINAEQHHSAHNVANKMWPNRAQNSSDGKLIQWTAAAPPPASSSWWTERNEMLEHKRKVASSLNIAVASFSTLCFVSSFHIYRIQEKPCAKSSLTPCVVCAIFFSIPLHCFTFLLTLFL